MEDVPRLKKVKTLRQSLHPLLFNFSSRKHPSLSLQGTPLVAENLPHVLREPLKPPKDFALFAPLPPWVGVSELRQPKYFLLQTFSALSVRDWQTQCKLNHTKLTQSWSENVKDVIVGLTTQEVARPHVCRPVTSD